MVFSLAYVTEKLHTIKVEMGLCYLFVSYKITYPVKPYWSYTFFTASSISGYPGTLTTNSVM